MKKTVLITVLSIFTVFNANAQYPEIYGSGGLEMYFQFADVKNNGQSESVPLRWVPLLNFQVLFNADFAKFIGVYGGVGMRNMGFIRDDFVTNDRYKHRTYNLAFPVGVKIGNMNKAFLYLGYNFEIPFHYKEKWFPANSKVVSTEWFSNRVQKFMHGYSAGVQFPGGINLTFTYYQTEFFNQGFSELDLNGVLITPYQGLRARMFAVSLAVFLFKNPKKYFK